MKLDSHALNREVASMFLLVGLEQVGPCLRFDTVIHNSEGASMRKLIFGGLLATTMLIPAFAADDMWRSSKLIGLNVYNDQNEKLGDISEILLDKSGKVEGVVIGVGGFLGMGQRDIKVELSKLKFVDEPMRSSAATTTTTTGVGGTVNNAANRATTAASNATASVTGSS